MAFSNRQKLIGTGILMLVFAAIQAPLWTPPDMPQYVNVGNSTAIKLKKEIRAAGVLEKKTVTLSVPNTRQVDLHGRSAGMTQLYVFYKDGQTSIYRVIVRDPHPQSHNLLAHR